MQLRFLTEFTISTMPGNELLSIINQVRENKGQLPVGELPPDSRLAEEHYDVDQVNRQMLAFMGLGAP